MAKRGRPTTTDRLLRDMQPRTEEIAPIGTDIVLPNHSGVSSHPEFEKALASISHNDLLDVLPNQHHEAVSVADTASVDLTLTTQLIKADVLPAGVDHDLLLNYVANEHIDWTNATDNFLTTGTGTFDDKIVINGFTPIIEFIDDSSAPQGNMRLRLDNNQMSIEGDPDADGTYENFIFIEPESTTSLKIQSDLKLFEFSPKLTLWDRSTSAYNFMLEADSNKLNFQVDTNDDGAANATPMTIDGATGNVGIGTTSPQAKLDVDGGDIFLSGANNEIRFYDTTNYVGLKAPTLTGNQIWELPTADGTDGQVLKTDGSGALGWAGGSSDKSWAFKSPSGTTGTFYYGGFYDHNSTDNDFNPVINFGTANSSYAAHFYVVCAAGSTGTTITVGGTSINDDGTRTTSDAENIVIPNGASAGDYFETSKKFIGQLTLLKSAGNDLLCNYGWAKYYDNHNTDFTVLGFEATWLGGANDSGANIELLHHKATGWTYNAGAAATPPTPIAAMATDHSTEGDVKNGENGCWKRSNLSTTVLGSASCGTIIRITTTANKAFDLGNGILQLRNS